jgi:hypothetical protein
MNPNHAIAGFLVSLTLFGLAGCQTADANHNGDLGVSSVQFQDIAIPAGLKLVERFHESHSREVAGWRFGHYEYVGQTTMPEACAHVLERMPQHDWKVVVDDASQANARHLQFKRGAYVVDYRLDRIDGQTQLVVEYDTQFESL